MNRRSFLIGLFGTAAVIAAGPIPKALEALPEKDFKDAILAALPKGNEIYGNGKDYAFAKVEFLGEAPWFKVTIPEGFKPLREESNRIGNEALARMYKDKS